MNDSIDPVTAERFRLIAEDIEQSECVVTGPAGPVVNGYLALFRSLPKMSPGSEFYLRGRWVQVCSYAVPCEEALQAIADIGPIVEVGAGTGYWAYLLRAMGVDVVAYDAAPPGTGPAANTYHPGVSTWTTVLQGGPERLADHGDRTLFLCWPPYDDPMAADCLHHYRGDRLAYVGEGSGGCTGDDRFHEELRRMWKCTRVVDIPTYQSIHDSLYLYKRR